MVTVDCLHPQTAAWLKDLDFTDSEDDAPQDNSSKLNDLATTASNVAERSVTMQSCGHNLLSLPSEVLLSILNQLDRSALAQMMQTSKGLRSTCLADSLWDKFGSRRVPQTRSHLQQYYKPRSAAASAFVPASTPDGATTDSQSTSQTPIAACPVQTSRNSLSQRYAFLDDKLKLHYCGSLVQQPAWLSLLPNVSCQGAGWLYAKAKWLSDCTLRQCELPYQNLHHHVRSKLHSMWLLGKVDDSLMLQRTLLKLTRISWSKAYETLGNAFVYVSDCIAMDLKTDFINPELQTSPTGSQAQSLWHTVLQVWQDYRTWLTRVCSLCTRLVECISAERAAEMMSRAKADTPTLFDMGKAAFRSEVILAYQLRSALQSSWEALLSSANSNAQSAEDAHVLLDVSRLLQELDVADDGTRPEDYHTQERMREVYGLGEYKHEHARNLLQLHLCSCHKPRQCDDLLMPTHDAYYGKQYQQTWDDARLSQ